MTARCELNSVPALDARSSPAPGCAGKLCGEIAAGCRSQPFCDLAGIVRARRIESCTSELSLGEGVISWPRTRIAATIERPAEPPVCARSPTSGAESSLGLPCTLK